MDIHPDTTPSKPPRRWWVRWLRRLGLVLLLALLVGICYELFVYFDGVKKLQAAKTGLDRTEPGWRWKDVASAPSQLPDDKNSFECVTAAANSLRPKWPPDRLWDQIKDTASQEQLRPETLEQLDKGLAEHQAALREAIRLADQPHGQPPLDTSLHISQLKLEDRNNVSVVSKLLECDILRLCQMGDLKGALLSCRALLHTARSVGDDPFVYSQSLRMIGVKHACSMVERILGQGEAPVLAMAFLQRALEAEMSHPGLFLALRGHRAATNEMLDALESGALHLSRTQLGDGTPPTWSDWLLGWYYRDRVRSEHALYLQMITRRISAAKETSHVQVQADKQFEKEIHYNWLETPGVRFVLLDLQKLGDASRLSQARLRCAIVALALEQYRRKHGSWPDSLKALTPDLLKSVPADPFDGQPLRYLRRNGGVVVYSVGSDLEDNRGRTDRLRPDEPGSDLVFRLWDVSQRRQPPRPKPPVKPAHPGMPGAFGRRPR